jgi:hypothetical protein
MWKWLLITLIVVIGFLVVLLGLGYLLKENERATTVLKQQLDQQAQYQQKKTTQRQLLITSTTDAPVQRLLEKQHFTPDKNTKLVVEQFQKIVIENITCVSSTQCVIAKVTFANVDCHVAINSIGASLLSKLKTSKYPIDNCPEFIEGNTLSCQQNVCTLP